MKRDHRHVVGDRARHTGDDMEVLKSIHGHIEWLRPYIREVIAVPIHEFHHTGMKTCRRPAPPTYIIATPWIRLPCNRLRHLAYRVIALIQEKNVVNLEGFLLPGNEKNRLFTDILCLVGDALQMIQCTQQGKYLLQVVLTVFSQGQQVGKNMGEGVFNLVRHGDSAFRQVGILLFEGVDRLPEHGVAFAGERGPLWITATSQNNGRGRSGRSWSTEPGNLAASLLFEPDCSVQHLPQLALVSGLAVHDAVTALLPGLRQNRVRIKWPNDVLIDGAKVSGILVESTRQTDPSLAVIGIGINLTTSPASPGRQMTALAYHPEFGGNFDEASLILATRLAGRLTQWNRHRGFPAIRDAWLARGFALGETLRINAGGDPIAGRFAGLDVDGALLLEVPGCGLQRFTYGDVTREADN